MKKKAPISMLVSHANDNKGTMAKVQVEDSSPGGRRWLVVLSHMGHLGQALLLTAVLSPQPFDCYLQRALLPHSRSRLCSGQPPLSP